jgi:hypothetical protein
MTTPSIQYNTIQTQLFMEHILTPRIPEQIGFRTELQLFNQVAYSTRQNNKSNMHMMLTLTSGSLLPRVNMTL